jgi:hypothetical protein
MSFNPFAPNPQESRFPVPRNPNSSVCIATSVITTILFLTILTLACAWGITAVIVVPLSYDISQQVKNGSLLLLEIATKSLQLGVQSLLLRFYDSYLSALVDVVG